jgi:DNA/RNA-binding domain of Phe-tRNA-synthetase-like protein
VNLRIHEAVREQVRIGVAWFSGLDAGEENPHWPEMEALAETLRRTHGTRPPGEIEGLQAARRLYRTFGVDPTRTRPSSEALLRRVLKGQSLYRINRLVDACNWGSLAMLLPVGLYDRDRIEGDITLRVGGAGEFFEGIRKGDVHVEGRLTLADDRGPFGSPTSDSLRTSVRPDTTRALVVVFAPGDFPGLELEEGMTRLVNQVTRWCDGEEEGAWILGENGKE